ncbi:MAG: hypothetical protein ACTHNS_00460 [Marmoricola sp.]
MDSGPDDGVALVQLDRDHAELLLYFARIGEKASSRRSWRHGFRRQACCSGREREPECVSCQAFTAVEAVLEASGPRI